MNEEEATRIKKELTDSSRVPVPEDGSFAYRCRGENYFWWGGRIIAYGRDSKGVYCRDTRVPRSFKSRPAT